MIYDTLELKKALPDGVICVVVGGHWNDDLYVKTGDSMWASIPRSMRVTPEETLAYAEKMRSEKSFNVSPAPPEKLKLWFEESNVNKVLGMMAGTIERSKRLQRIIDETDGAIDDFMESAGNLRAHATRTFRP